MVKNTRAFALASTLALSVGLAACDGASNGNGVTMPPIVSAPAPTPSPVPSPTPASLNVSPCLNQVVAQGRTVANLVVPMSFGLI